MPRAQHKSGAALRYERQRREATAALAAQAAQVRALREVEPPAVPAGGDEQVLITPLEPAAAPAMSAFPTAQEVPKADMRHETGRWPLLALRAGQCRFPCTPHDARPHEHLFCGEPVAWVRGKPTSYCRCHLPVVSGAPGRAAGGASVADAERGYDDRDADPARRGWGSTGA